MQTKKLTELGLLLAVSLVLSYFESLIPAFIPIPGVKLGLANVVTLLVLYQNGGRQAFVFTLLRVVLSGFLFSGVSGIMYGLAGGMCSLFVMSRLLKCPAFSVLGISAAGGISHNLGQIIVAVLVMENVQLFYYFAVLLLSGTLSGFLIGYLGFWLFKQYHRIFPQE